MRTDTPTAETATPERTIRSRAMTALLVAAAATSSLAMILTIASAALAST